MTEQNSCDESLYLILKPINLTLLLWNPMTTHSGVLGTAENRGGYVQIKGYFNYCQSQCCQSHF